MSHEQLRFPVRGEPLPATALSSRRIRSTTKLLGEERIGTRQSPLPKVAWRAGRRRGR